jgi:NTP pyrophosphatase (non-canonical NTP hydrolase)
VGESEPQATLAELQRRVEAFRDERDWRQFHSLKDLAAAIAIEAGELQELFLWAGREEEAGVLAGRTDEVADELADILIQCLNFASAAGVDINHAVAVKLDKNAVKYPVERARGTSRKYSDL